MASHDYFAWQMFIVVVMVMLGFVACLCTHEYLEKSTITYVAFGGLLVSAVGIVGIPVLVASKGSK